MRGEVRVEEAVATGQGRPHAKLVNATAHAGVAVGRVALNVAAEGHRAPDREAALEGDEPRGHVRALLLVEHRVLETHVQLVETAAHRALEDQLAVGAAERQVRVARVGRVEPGDRDDLVAQGGAVALVDAGGGGRAARATEHAVVGALVEAVLAGVGQDDRKLEVQAEVAEQPELDGRGERVAELLEDEVLDQAVLVVADPPAVPLAKDRRALVVEVVGDPEVHVEDVVVFERGGDSRDVGGVGIARGEAGRDREPQRQTRRELARRAASLASKRAVRAARRVARTHGRDRG